MTNKQHLGDCVYADISGDCIVLTTEDVRIVNTIYLNREVVDALLKYVQENYKGLTQHCPRCKCSYYSFPALSRRDNETYICSACGQDEAFEDVGFIQKYAGAPYWKEPTK